MAIISIVENGAILKARKAVLQMAADMDIDSTVLIAALADVVGITAATLEHSGGAHQRVGIDARLESFTDRARETYERTRQNQVNNETMLKALAAGRMRT